MMPSLTDYRKEIELYILQWGFVRSGMDHDRIAIWLSAGAIAILLAKNDVFLSAHVDRVIFGVTIFLAILCVQAGLMTVAIDRRYILAIVTNDGTLARWNRVLAWLETAVRISFFSWSALLAVGLFFKFFWRLT